MADTRRYTMDVGADIDTQLTRLAQAEGRPKSEVIRRALATYDYLKSQTKEPGNTVSITTQDGQRRDVILP